MKLSELIRRLKAIKNTKGDIGVRIEVGIYCDSTEMTPLKPEDIGIVEILTEISDNMQECVLLARLGEEWQPSA